MLLSLWLLRLLYLATPHPRDTERRESRATVTMEHPRRDHLKHDTGFRVSHSGSTVAFVCSDWMCACIYKYDSRCQSGSTMARTNSVRLFVARSGSAVAQSGSTWPKVARQWLDMWLNLSWVRQWFGSRQRVTFRVHDGHVELHGNSVDNVCFHSLCLYWKRQSRRLALIVPGAGVELLGSALIDLTPYRRSERT